MGTIKAIFGVFTMVAVVVLCAMLIPPFFANYQFQDEIETDARLATYTSKTEDTIREEILKKATELEIPVTKDQIKVKRSGQQGTGTVAVEVNYSVHVNLPMYPLDLTFNPATKNHGAW